MNMNEPIPVDERLLPPEGIFQPAPRRLLNLNYAWLVIFALSWAFVSFLENRWLMPAGASNWCLGGLVGALILLLISRTRRTRTWTNRAREAIVKLHSGDPEDAQAAGKIFDELCRESYGTPMRHMHAGFVYNRAVIYLYAGNPDRALALNMAVFKSRWFEEQRYGMFHYLPEILENTARCYAIKGALEKAEEYQLIAHDVTEPEREARLVLLDLVIAIRRGRYDVAIKDADARREEIEKLMSPADVKSVRVLRAFALKLQKPDLSEAEMTEALEGTKFFTEGQFDYLAVSWPEFREFLAAHRFTATTAALPNA